MRRGAILAIVLALVLGACGSGEDETGEEPEQSDEVCIALADRWITIQQRLLDAIGEATPGEVASPSAQLAAAFGGTAASLLEINRDTHRAGCESQVRSGSALICARLNRLLAGGPAGDDAMSSLRAAC